MARAIKRKRIIIRDEVLDAQQRARDSLLIRFVSEGKVSAIEETISRGASVNAKDRTGQTPLHIACASHECGAEVVGVLLASGADVNPLDAQQQTPLDVAAHNGSTDKAAILENNGALRSARLLQSS